MNNYLILAVGFLIGAPVWSVITIYLINYLEKPRKAKPNYDAETDWLLSLDEHEKLIS